MQSQGTTPFKSPRLLGHPLHPMLTDFPLALWSISLLGDLVGIWRGDELFHKFAFWNIVLGLAFAIPTMVTGLLEFAAIPDGHPGLKAAMRHLWIMLIAAVLFGCSLVFRIGQFASSTGALWVAIIFSLLGLCCLVIGGWFGGEMVFRFGIGSQEKDI